MRPYEVKFYIYAKNEQEVQDLQKELNGFVREKYNNGILVTTEKLLFAMKKFSNNFFVNSFLK